MKREIKFRVWDKEENKFFKPVYEAYKGHLLDLSISLSGQFLRRTLSLQAEHESCFPDKYELNQFTGLFDKNGVKIYEGDILEFPLEMGIAYVINDGFRFAVKSYGSEAVDYESQEVLEQTKVIGNIYEHKHLLE